MSIISTSDMVLRNTSKQTFSSSGASSYTITSLTYTKMGKRTQFNINYQVSGVQSYYASVYKPNIIESSVSIRGQGISSADGFF